MKISVCIDMMFSHLDFYDRFSAVKNCGIDTIEFWKWSNKDIEAVSHALQENNQSISIFNLDSSDEDLSYDLSRGILNAGRTEDFLKALKESLPIYKKWNAEAMIVLIGEHQDYNEENVLSCLSSAKPFLEENDIHLVIEPLNNIDREGYSMPYAKPVFELLHKLNSPNIKMLYDIYHQSMMQDFSLDDIKNNIDIIGHFHVADAPGRHEVGTGTVDYISIINAINRLPYTGCIGLEYHATKPDHETLNFLKEVSHV